MLENGEYPAEWGKGIIAPIFKKGDPNKAENDRGITLINVLSKIYSQILLNRLTKWNDINEHLCKNQFGFQKDKSVIDCIIFMLSFQRSSRREGNFTVLLSIMRSALIVLTALYFGRNYYIIT